MHDSNDILLLSQKLRQSKQPHVIATVVRCELPSSGKPGQKALIDDQGQVSGWIGGGCAEPTVLLEARKALQQGEPRLVRITPAASAAPEPGIIEVAMTCHSGGVLDIFIEPVLPKAALLIMGGSEAARDLVAPCRLLGLEVSVAADEALLEQFSDCERRINGFELGSYVPDYIVIATQGKKDEQALIAALSTDARYIGFIASQKKWQKLKTMIQSSSQQKLDFDRVRAPAGLNLGGISPAEIAISVAAELLQVRRRGSDMTQATGGSNETSACCGSAKSSIELPVLNNGSLAAGDEKTAVDPICGMTVNVDGAQYVSKTPGQTFYFCCEGCMNLFESQNQAGVASGGN